MTKDDALRIALNALLGCTYDERMRAIGAVKDALSGGETAAEAPAPAGPARVRNPRMWAVIKAGHIAPASASLHRVCDAN